MSCLWAGKRRGCKTGSVEWTHIVRFGGVLWWLLAGLRLCLMGCCSFGVVTWHVCMCTEEFTGYNSRQGKAQAIRCVSGAYVGEQAETMWTMLASTDLGLLVPGVVETWKALGDFWYRADPPKTKGL